MVAFGFETYVDKLCHAAEEKFDLLAYLFGHVSTFSHIMMWYFYSGEEM